MQLFWSALSAEKQGIWLYCCAIVLFSVMDIVAKDLMTRHSSMQVVWARYASQFFWTVIVLSPRLRSLVRTNHLGLQLIRSACLFGGTAFFFTSLKHLNLAEAVAIFNISPFLITILSVIVLKELVGIRRWLGVAIGLSGALIIIQPGAEIFTPASILPVLAAICFAGYAISTRFLGSDEPAATSFFYTTLIGTIVATILLPFSWETPTLPDAAIMATFGVIGACGHILLIIALGLTQASVVAPFTYLGVVRGAFWGFVFFAEVPALNTWIGTIVIIGAGLYVWHREKSVKENS